MLKLKKYKIMFELFYAKIRHILKPTTKNI